MTSERRREQVRLNMRAYRKRHPERVIAKNALPKARAARAAWQKAHPELRRAAQKRWRDKNPDVVARRNREWDQANPERRRAIVAKRNALKRKATPAWADLTAIAEFYKQCPPGHHVDHAIPLTSPKVCGLHVFENLQYLPALANLAKGSRFNG